MGKRKKREEEQREDWKEQRRWLRVSGSLGGSGQRAVARNLPSPP